MKHSLSRTLPGFKMFNAFFSDLKGAFEPTILTEKQKAVFLQAISALDGSPQEVLRPLREDLGLTAKVRETRRYADGRTFVRYEFNRLESNCTWSAPYQLMAAFGQTGNLESYTVLRGRGEVSDGLAFAISPRWYNWENHEETRNADIVLARLKDYGECEVALRNVGTGEWFAYIYGRGGRYIVEWYICCDPWLMTAGGLSYQQIEAMVAAVREHGIKGLEDAIEWRQFDFEALQQKHGVFVQVDANLYRSLELAKRRGDEMRVKTVRALGIGDGKVDEPYSIRIPSGTLAAHRRSVFNKAAEEDDKAKAAKLFAMLAMRGHTQSRCNLGYHFHFGVGVPVDYDLAIYWHTLAALAGDAYAMTNLGKIYSEKDGPKWNGPEAIKWFEKAVAKGETWAMGELGHCLLCGECAGKDVVRARSLLEKAVAANPGREDCAEKLARARNEKE